MLIVHNSIILSLVKIIICIAKTLPKSLKGMLKDVGVGHLGNILIRLTKTHSLNYRERAVSEWAAGTRS